jgi:hypothetical protein
MCWPQSQSGSNGEQTNAFPCLESNSKFSVGSLDTIPTELSSPKNFHYIFIAVTFSYFPTCIKKRFDRGKKFSNMWAKDVGLESNLEKLSTYCCLVTRM